jgi:hypothetical protein
MKIVHIVDYFQPVLGYQEAFLAKEHAKLGHEVFVITSDRYAPVLYHKGAAFSILLLCLIVLLWYHLSRDW